MHFPTGKLVRNHAEIVSPRMNSLVRGLLQAPPGRRWGGAGTSQPSPAKLLLTASHNDLLFYDVINLPDCMHCGAAGPVVFGTVVLLN